MNPATLEQTQPLVGDPLRQAIDSILGYDYQIVRTVEAWLGLRDDETIYIECAEDYDVVGPDSAVATQVKNSPSTITLNSGDVNDAVRNFWALKERNSKREHISLRFLTRGGIGKEQKSKFGAVSGLLLWRQAAAGDDEAARLVADHLIEQGGTDSFLDFLRKSDGASLRDALFARIEWVADDQSIDAARIAVTRLAVRMGERQNTPPIIAARAVPGLLDHCRQTAVKKEVELRSLTLADAQLVFSQHTTLPVPITNQLAATMGLVAVRSGGGLAELSFAPVLDGEVPELPFQHLPRETFIADLTKHALVSGCILVVGSEGEGKSTGANMLARAIDPAPFWLDLRGGDEQISVAAIESAIVIARSSGPPKCIALDDVPAAQGVSDALWGRLQALIDSCRRAGSILIMTSKGVPVDAIDPKFRAARVQVAAVPRIGEQELVDYLVLLGCNEFDDAQSWARVTLAHTGGHPKLVYLAALELRDRGWKAADVAEFIAVPHSVEQARAVARQTATRVVPHPDRDLLFALSLTTVPFERKVALELGQRLGLSEPGAVFDRLAGRWIELRGSAGYKSTPLLNGQAKELWTAERVQLTHALLLDSYIATKSIRLDQAMGVFLHAFQSQDSRRFIKFVTTMLAQIEKTEGLPEALELVVHFGPVDGALAIAFDEGASVLFRYLQFRVARARRPELLPDIAGRWLWEIDRLTDSGHQNFMRGLRGMAIAVATEHAFSAVMIIDAIQDAFRLESLGIGLRPITAGDMQVHAPDPQKPVDAMQILFMLVQANFGTARRVREMVIELERLPAGFRSRLLSGYSLPLAREGFSMFDRALVAEAKLAAPEWKQISLALSLASEKGREWGDLDFANSATRVLSIILSEYVGDHEAARVVLDKAATARSSPVIVEQMANLAFHRGNHDEAVRLWNQSLSGSELAGELGVRDPFAMRFAAIACSKLGLFGQAAEWFERAAGLVSTEVIVMPPALFRSDACYCWFKHGDAPRALRSAEASRREVSNFTDREAQPRLFAAQKFAAHMLSWMMKEVAEPIANLFEPEVGAASNPDLDVEALSKEPAPSLRFLALMVVELALLLGIDEPWLTDAMRTVQASTDPVVVMRYRAAKLRALLGKGSYGQVAIEIHEINEAFLSMSLAPEETNFKLGELALDLAYHGFALTLSLATMNNVDTLKLVEDWRESLASFPRGELSAAIADNVAQAFDVSGNEAMTLMRRGSNWVGRIGAASRVLASDARSPRDTTQAQCVLAYVLISNGGWQVLRAGANALADAFGGQWERHLAFTALLVSPRFTVPKLQQAISSQEPATRRLLALVLAGSEASGEPVPSSIMDTLRETAASNGPREARAQELTRVRRIPG